MTLTKLKKPAAMKGLKGIGRRRKVEPLPKLGEQPDRIAGLIDDELAKLTRDVGDEQLAKRILKLQEQHPDGTIPELVVMDWLMRRGVKWDFQVWVLGGRVLRGGQVLDFVVDQGTKVMVIEVQGRYWHTRPGKLALDAAQKLALLGLTIWGKSVAGVVEVWDSRLLNKHQRNRTMEMALAGVELGV